MGGEGGGVEGGARVNVRAIISTLSPKIKRCSRSGWLLAAGSVHVLITRPEITKYDEAVSPDHLCLMPDREEG